MSIDEALLLRVGIDSGTGRAHGPLFDDGRFEYIPIPESRETVEERTYDDIVGRSGEAFSAYVPHLADKTPHYDPEFRTYTYGDPSRIKRSQLARLTEGDLLVFYAGLEPLDGSASALLYTIGYFTVAESYDLEAMTPAERENALARLSQNAHVKLCGLTAESSGPDERYPVIVQGKPTQSGLFRRPRPLGTEDRGVIPEVSEKIGFQGDLTRAGTARVLDAEKSESILSWLNGTD
jgi:hypothetical protein